MGKFADTLKKNFLPVLIASIMITAVDFILDGICRLSAAIDFMDYMSVILPSETGIILKLLIISPFCIGVSRFLFKRSEGENPRKSSVFDYYRSVKRIIGAAAAKMIPFILPPLFSGLFLCLGFAARSPGLKYAMNFLSEAITAVSWSLLWLAEYVYAKTPEIGVLSSVADSVKQCFKSIRTLGAALAAGLFSYSILFFLHGRIIALISENPVFSCLLRLAEAFLVMWVSVTIAYLILYKFTASENADNENVRDDDKEPFYEN